MVPRRLSPYIHAGRVAVARAAVSAIPEGGAVHPDPALATEDYCYITTTGRVSGRPHTIEIWFALHDATVYVLAGSGHHADFVKNARKLPETGIRIATQMCTADARVVSDASEDALARRLLLEKYRPRYSGDLDEWGRTALPVAFDMRPPAA